MLFTFPSRYLFTIGRQEYLALEGGPPGFPRDSTGPAVLKHNRSARGRFAYGALPTKLRPRAAPPPVRGVGVPGIEPGTSVLSGPRSNRLSYTPRGPGAWSRGTLTGEE